MSKNKYKNRTTSFSDIITLQNLKWIILISFILSVLCEFLPSLFNICKFFNYNSFVMFLQLHKDFFTNIALGCLASAVISYIMLLIPHRIKEQKQKEEILLHREKVISNFLVLYTFIKELTTLENNEVVEIYIDKIKNENNNLYTSIVEFIEVYQRVDNIQKCDNFLNICQDKILLLIKEIEVFFNVYETSEKVEFPIEATNEIFKLLFDRLDNNYDLKKVKDDFENEIPIPRALMKDKNKVSEDLKEIYDLVNTSNQVKFYSNEIFNIHMKYLHKEQEDLELQVHQMMKNNNPT